MDEFTIVEGQIDALYHMGQIFILPVFCQLEQLILCTITTTRWCHLYH